MEAAMDIPGFPKIILPIISFKGGQGAPPKTTKRTTVSQSKRTDQRTDKPTDKRG
jgi:hypothetical protein